MLSAFHTGRLQEAWHRLTIYLANTTKSERRLGIVSACVGEIWRKATLQICVLFFVEGMCDTGGDGRVERRGSSSSYKTPQWKSINASQSLRLL